MRIANFNFDKAKAGAKVVTADKTSVRILCWDRRDHEYLRHIRKDFPIVALVPKVGEFGEVVDRVCSFDRQGHMAGRFNDEHGRIYLGLPEKFVSLQYWGDHVEPGQIWEEDLENYGWIEHEGTRINAENFTDFDKYFERKED